MTVTVHMHGNLRRFMPDGRDRSVVEVSGDTRVEGLLVSLGATQDTWLVAVNGTTVERDYVLHPDDVVECFEPVAGGGHSDTRRHARCR